MTKILVPKQEGESGLKRDEVPRSWYKFMKAILPGMDPCNMEVTGRWNDWRGDGAKPHEGSDVQGKFKYYENGGRGQAVCSPFGGEVIDVNRDQGLVTIVGPNGRAIVFRHMREIPDWVEKGKSISCGKQVGVLSNKATKHEKTETKGNHLHFEVGQAEKNAAGKYTGKLVAPLDPEAGWIDSWSPCGGGGPFCFTPECFVANFIVHAQRPFEDALAFLDPFSRRDPLILDLDRDGIETVNVKIGHFLDYDGNGFAEQTGWADNDDGMLVIDRNGDGIINDGKELIGDQAISKNGTRPANGFQALAELDGNADGKIDANDPIYPLLRVAKNFDDCGFSFASEFYTLDQLGITSIYLNSTPDSGTDPGGNTRIRVGTFEKADGSSNQIVEYSFQQDRVYTIATEWLEVPENIAALPDLVGYGNVYDLHQALVRDSTGQLESLVEQFGSATDQSARNILMDQILLKWTGSENIDPASRGGNMDARKLAVLEKFFGRSFVGVSGPNPTYQASILLNESYRRIFELMYAQLMWQTHLSDLYARITYAWDDEKQDFNGDFINVITELQAQLAQNPEQGKLLLSEFARTMRGLGHDRVSCLPCREIFIMQDPELGWVIDTGGLPVYEHVGQGLHPNSPHIEGTDNADAVMGSLTEGDGWLNGQEGDDAIYGTSRNEILVNERGDALLVAGGGNDLIWAGEGMTSSGPGREMIFWMAVKAVTSFSGKQGMTLTYSGEGPAKIL